MGIITLITRKAGFSLLFGVIPVLIFVFSTSPVPVSAEQSVEVQCTAEEDAAIRKAIAKLGLDCKTATATLEATQKELEVATSKAAEANQQANRRFKARCITALLEGKKPKGCAPKKLKAARRAITEIQSLNSSAKTVEERFRPLVDAATLACEQQREGELALNQYQWACPPLNPFRPADQFLPGVFFASFRTAPPANSSLPKEWLAGKWMFNFVMAPTIGYIGPSSSSSRSFTFYSDGRVETAGLYQCSGVCAVFSIMYFGRGTYTFDGKTLSMNISQTVTYNQGTPLESKATDNLTGVTFDVSVEEAYEGYYVSKSEARKKLILRFKGFDIQSLDPTGLFPSGNLQLM